jgi:hypothetical protein
MKGSRIALAVIGATVIALSGGVALAATGQGHPAAAINHAAHHSAAAPAATRHRSSAGHHTTVLMDCLGKAVTRPSSFMIACADGGQYLSRLRWASWTRGLASGTGNFTFNTCTPSCAAGKFITSKVIAVLWHVAGVPHRHSLRQFSMMTVIYSGKRPAHTAQSFTEALWYPTTR